MVKETEVLGENHVSDLHVTWDSVGLQTMEWPWQKRLESSYSCHVSVTNNVKYFHGKLIKSEQQRLV
jgi:hypothetical protein